MAKMTDYQRFIATSRYARWREKDNRRETWTEVVTRFTDYVTQDVVGRASEESLEQLDRLKTLHHMQMSIQNLEVMPSMRALMTAGPAHERCHVAGYNCAYLPVESPRSFDETMYILMCGTGVGFSVEKKNVERLPQVSEHFEPTSTTIIVGDSKSGWARSLRELISLLYAGQVPAWDTSAVRLAGERLKTFGGRASGPAPLEALFDFVVETFRNASGRRLSPLECHDIMCKIGEVVVVGGVRRSALISLSDLDDIEMASAKHGDWWRNHPHRALANNSAVYNGAPNVGQYLKEWTSIYESKSGERGIFNRRAVDRQVKRSGRRVSEDIDFGTNPCSEIILRPYQFCNLTEVVVRSTDTRATLKRKLDTAVFLGTIQASWTSFKYLRKIWRQNCEEERLLGVSLTGIYDHPTLALDPKVLKELKEYVVERNVYYSTLLGLNQSVSTTCVKPSGTVSQLVDSASGLHPRHSAYYRRTVRGDNKDPLTRFLKDQGVQHEPDVMKPDDTTVFSFYQKAPTGAMTRAELPAAQHLQDWLLIQEHWCEHKPSVTINIKDSEWPVMGGLVYDNFETMTGVALLPFDEHTYKQAPYQELTKEQYDKESEEYNIDWDWFTEGGYETEDTTTGSQELACSGGNCEIVDIGT